MKFIFKPCRVEEHVFLEVHAKPIFKRMEETLLPWWESDTVMWQRGVDTGKYDLLGPLLKLSITVFYVMWVAEVILKARYIGNILYLCLFILIINTVRCIFKNWYDFNIRLQCWEYLPCFIEKRLILGSSLIFLRYST